MTAVGRIPDVGNGSTISMFGPTESPVQIDGRLYRIQTWTEAQWSRMPAQDQPSDAWRHGAMWMRIQPS